MIYRQSKLTMDRELHFQYESNPICAFDHRKATQPDNNSETRISAKLDGGPRALALSRFIR